MKRILLSLIIVKCSFLLIACQAPKEEITLIDSIYQISISKSNGYGGLNEDYFLSINKQEVITEMEQIFESAKGEKRKVNVKNEKPDYDMLIRYKNGETNGFHIQLGDNGEESIITYIGHERDAYIISPDYTNRLKEILE